MGLMEDHKTDRRERILTAAKQLLASSGYDALTMRDLAETARVSVPTIYNLIGGKHSVLVELFEEMFMGVSQSVPNDAEAPPLERVVAILEGGYRVLLDAPSYSRALVEMCLTSGEEEAQELRQSLDTRFIGLMACVLEDGKRQRCVESWVDGVAVASTMYAGYISSLLRWAKREITDEQLPAISNASAFLALLGVTRGAMREAAQCRFRALQPAVSSAVHSTIHA